MAQQSPHRASRQLRQQHPIDGRDKADPVLDELIEPPPVYLNRIRATADLAVDVGALGP